MRKAPCFINCKNFQFITIASDIIHISICQHILNSIENGFKVLPKRRYFAGKKYTFPLEQNNSNTRHYLARMVRKSKVISRSEFMLNASLKLLFALSFDSSIPASIR